MMNAAERPLWTSLGLIDPLGARMSGVMPPGGVKGISIDSRTLREGDLFFAIRGPNSDGHDYVRAAFEKGAAAAVVDEAHADALRPLGPLYVVHDVLPALERLGAAARSRSPARIVAVTGSVGKTSTKEALRLVLSGAGPAHAAAASYNNHWGVPLTLARMPKQTRFGIYEIGMNHRGEISPLAQMVRPHVAIITTIAPEAEAQICGKRMTYRLGAPGRHMAMNALPVLLTAKAFGLDLDEAAKALACFSPQPGRGEMIELQAQDGPFTLIDDSYNANPASMRAALAVAGGLPLGASGRRIAVLGDMLELGGRASLMHAELVPEIEQSGIDLVFAAGPLMKHLYGALPQELRGSWRESAVELAPLVEAAVRGGDIVLVKGSNAAGMKTIIEVLKEKCALHAAAQSCESP